MIKRKNYLIPSDYSLISLDSTTGFNDEFIADNQLRIMVLLYLTGCGLANSSTEVDWYILLNPVCRTTECANKVL